MPKEPTPAPDSQVTPDPKLEKSTRRTFKSEYKLRIIQEADACKHARRAWRREYAENSLAGLSKSSPGPTPERSADQREID